MELQDLVDYPSMLLSMHKHKEGEHLLQCLTPISTIFPLYHGLWWSVLLVEKGTDKLYHIMLHPVHLD